MKELIVSLLESLLSDQTGKEVQIWIEKTSENSQRA